MAVDFSVGDNAWFIQTAGKKPEEDGCHACTVTAVNEGKFECTATIDDPESLLDGTSITAAAAKKSPDGKANSAYMGLRDDTFKDNGYDDMVNLRYLNDGALNQNLKVRFGQDLSYCNTWVAINLFYRWSKYQKALSKALHESRKEWQKAVAEFQGPVDDDNCPKAHGGSFDGQPVDCFAADVKERYLGAVRTDNEPHVYALVSEGYRQLFEATTESPVPKQQAIVITGESGAGKTYTTGKVLDFIDSINQNAMRLAGAEPLKDSLTKRIMKTMPIMDAFGNSCMPRNDDSSRFGKLYKIYFNKRSQQVTGASVTPYLLEKNRVCMQASWERNFHVFYYLLRAADDGMKKKYRLLDMRQYYYLNRFLYDDKVMCESDRIHASSAGLGPIGLSDENRSVVQFDICDSNHFNMCNEMKTKSEDEDGHEAPGGDDRKAFEELMEALHANEFSEATIDEIWRITSAVLLFGNIRFEDDLEAKLYPGSDIIVREISELLECDYSQLLFCLTQFYFVRPNQPPLLANHKRRTASALKDAMARTLYNDMFEAIIDGFSSRLKPATAERDTYLGVLDIFGFEFVEREKLIPGSVVNSFEQFCINLCNEKLQNHFVGCVFNSEILNYKDQGLMVTTDDFDFVPNDETVRLLQDRARDQSILAVLDSDSRNPMLNDTKGDDTFQGNLEKSFKDPKNWTIKGQTVPSAFSVPRKSARTGYEGGNMANGGPRGGFMIRHYAAEVIYDVEGWLDKNRDSVGPEAYKAIASSGLPAKEKLPESPSIIKRFVNLRRPDDDEDVKSRKASTLGGNFRDNLFELVDGTLNTCKCAFVRCLKPNTLKVPAVYDGALILNQLQYTGMLDTLIIRKEGWPCRPLHEDFFFAYKPLCPDATDYKSLAALLGQREGQLSCSSADAPKGRLKEVTIFVGKDRVLIKDDTARQMEKERAAMLSEWGNVVQSVYLGSTNAHVYKATREVYTSTLVPQTRSFLALGNTAQAHEQVASQEDWGSMRSYLLSLIHI
eukprot:TRINITY_DN9247_c0_g2_i6.p1 TRINITY_DN9247_c0_g2~~TRINITY_DN9247_c0_g2_i6.p1  ORF type:complete len:1008 (+),score=215.87 TRINITY_DN9247_c0_g2_i6:201-3224(+)